MSTAPEDAAADTVPIGAVRQLRIALVLLVLLPIVGTIGYRRLTGATWLDALYHTIITISTVGYGERVPIDTPAAKVFTIGLILSAVLITAWAASTVAELIVVEFGWQAWRRQRMQRRIDHLSGHTIICGYGRMGRRVAEELTGENEPWVVVDRDAALAESIASRGGYVVVGDATNDDTLRRAGVERARAVIGVTREDAENIVLTLSARALNPGVRIAVRANQADSVPKLRRAGADYVLQHHGSAATHLVLAVTHPVVEAALGLLLPRTSELDLGQVVVTPGSRLLGRDLRSIEPGRRGALVVALCRDDRLKCPPPIDVPLAVGDVLVVAGPAGAVRALREQAGGMG